MEKMYSSLNTREILNLVVRSRSIRAWVIKNNGLRETTCFIICVYIYEDDGIPLYS